MANLNGQNIGTNYKGIINIGSTINQNVSASLQSLTDGDGNNLPIQFSTSQASIGGGTGTGRLVVRGDGTNPIVRFEDNTAAALFLSAITAQAGGTGGMSTLNSRLTISSGNASLTGTSGILFLNNVQSNTYFWGLSSFNINGITGQVTGWSPLATAHRFLISGTLTNTSGYVFNVNNENSYSATSGEQGIANIFSTFAAAAGSAVFRPLNINYTINNSGAQTGTATGIFLNATETALNSMTHNLMDLQVGGTSRFRINNSGVLNITSEIRSLAATTGLVLRSWNTGTGGINFNASNNLYGSLEFYLDNISDNLNYFNFARGSGGTTLVRFTATGINMFGTTSTTNPARLLVRGDGTNAIARFETNAGAEAVSVSSTGLLVANSGLFVNLSAGIAFSGSTGTITVSGGFLYQTAINGGYQSGHIFRGISNGTYTNTTGDAYNAQFTIGFNPTSGTGRYTTILLNYAINQTGGANGITRGIFINPTLTSAPDFRAIDVQAGNSSAHKLIRLATAADGKVFEVTAASEIGFFGVAPITKPTVSGQRANPEDALLNLLTALSNLGLITDSTIP